MEGSGVLVKMFDQPYNRTVDAKANRVYGWVDFLSQVEAMTIGCT
jgi:hypothetical protein